MMTYAGFGKRFMAVIIDIIIYLPFMFFFNWLQLHGKAGLLISAIGAGIITQSYYIISHYYFGQSIGKKIMKIKVLSSDGSGLSLRQSIQRNIVDIALNLVVITGYLAIFQTISDSELINKSHKEIMKIVMGALPIWHQKALNAYTYWSLASSLCVLLNTKKKALHDFVGNTVVVDLMKSPK